MYKGRISAIPPENFRRERSKGTFSRAQNILVEENLHTPGRGSHWSETGEIRLPRRARLHALLRAYSLRRYYEVDGWGRRRILNLDLRDVCIIDTCIM